MTQRGMGKNQVIERERKKRVYLRDLEFAKNIIHERRETQKERRIGRYNEDVIGCEIPIVWRI